MNLDTLKKEVSDFLLTIGFELYDIELKETKKEKILTIYVDHENEITIDDVVEATNQLNPFLDDLDPIQGEYMLEVSSAGAEKELRNEKAIKSSIGKHIHIETYEQTLEGTLEEFDGFDITIKIKNKKFKINYDDVNLIRLAIKF
jgi:ribosome maturation factor RimP